jgi:hypothetical protein
MPRARVSERSSPENFPCVGRIGWDGLVIWSVCRYSKGEKGEGANRMNVFDQVGVAVWPVWLGRLKDLSLAWNLAGLQECSIWVGAFRAGSVGKIVSLRRTGYGVYYWTVLDVSGAVGTSFDAKNFGWGNVFFCWVHRA